MATYEDILSVGADGAVILASTAHERVSVGAAAVTSLAGRTISTIINTADASVSVAARRGVRLSATANATASVSAAAATLDILGVGAAATCGLRDKVTSYFTATADGSVTLQQKQYSNFKVGAAAAVTLDAVRSAHDAVSVLGTGFTVVSGKRSVTLSTTANATSAVSDKTTQTVSVTADGSVAVQGVRSIHDAVAAAANATITLSQYAHLYDTLAAGADAEVTLLQPGPGAALWVNTMSLGAAEWHGLRANSLAMVGGGIVVANETGLAKLVDDGDDPTGPVPAEVTWDSQDFGSPQMKRLDCAYVAGYLPVPALITVATAQGSFGYPTHLTGEANVVNHRATLGKGLTGVYARIGINTIGPVAVNTFYVQVGEVTRRRG